LTSGEKRHAQFFNSPFLREAERLVSRYRRYVEHTRILSPSQVDRMMATELFAELLMSLHNGGPINKKTSLDRAIGNDDVNGNTLGRLRREFIRSMNLVRRVFPLLRETRFRNSVEFYSLFLLVWEMDRERFVLSDRRRNRIAFELMRRLSTGVDELRDQLRRARPARPSQRIFSDYLLTVQGDTDSSANRERRRELLRGVLWTLFERKDSKRVFSSEQRRILWNSDDKRKCARCRKPLTWTGLTLDHVKAWSRGGKTTHGNAALMHRACNSSKGARS
jgi:5-methylcytosine-specific restriction endonuclease McrA